MSDLDRELLAERSASVLAHLDRVAAHIPDDPADLRPMSSATDTVVLHLWQAIQIVIDLAASIALRGPDDLRAFLGALRNTGG